MRRWRPRGTDVAAYAGKVAGQVRSLLAAGVPPRRVAVVGFSKGGAIALVAASSLHHRDVRFVSLAGCGDWLFDHFKLDLAGRVLSLYDVADDLANSCARAFSAASKPFEHREIVLHVGKGHGTFFRPDPAWLDPVTEWLAPERRARRQSRPRGGMGDRRQDGVVTRPMLGPGMAAWPAVSLGLDRVDFAMHLVSAVRS